MSFLFQPRTAFLISLLVAIGALGAAFVAQFVFGLKPCIMCLWQRLPYALIIANALAGILLARTPAREKHFLLGLTALFLASAGLAFFHFGIEQHWWTLEKGCPVGELKGKTEAEMLAEILATPLAECDKVAWRLLGWSITVWNTLLSLAMAGYLILVSLKKPHA